MAKEKTPSWVTDLLADAILKAGSAADLAKKLKISPSNFVNYDSGSTPSIQIIERIVNYVGGDIKRALPNYSDGSMIREAVPAYGAPGAALLGQVQAGAFCSAGDSKKTLPLDLRMWGKNTADMGIVEVVGDSMMPRYAPGQYLICERVKNIGDIRDGTPCIFEEHGETTFKLLRWLDKGQAIAQPINCDHKLIALTGRKVRVQLVVIGSIDLPRR